MKLTEPHSSGASSRRLPLVMSGLERLPIGLTCGILVGLLALTEALALGRLPLNLYDVSFTLDWGRELIHGQLPDIQVSGASTPHPLSILSGALAALFGSSALDVMRAVVFLAAGAMGVSLLVLGRACGSIAIGLLAALTLMLSEPFIDATLGQATASDLPSLAAVLGALALELSRPRRGLAPLLLLSVAGLWRPEVWLLSVAYWMYLAPERGWRERAWLGAVALSAPALWVTGDLLMTGNPLYSLTYTEYSTEAARRPTGLTHAPATLLRTLRAYFSTPILLGAAAGIGLDLWSRRLPRMVPVLLLLTMLAFAAIGAAKMPLDERYALPTTALVAIYFGFFLTGWRGYSPGRLRRAWILSAAVVLALSLALVPSSLRRIARAHRMLAAQARIEEQLGALLAPRQLRELISRCTPVQASWRIVPILAYDLGRQVGTISTVNSGVPRSGTVVEPAPGLAAQEFEAHPQPILSFIHGHYELQAENQGWLIYTHCPRTPR
jgi:hypothetical protein